MLLTRSPLYSHPKVPYSFDLHVLGTPPAFILSQDQTLRSERPSRAASDQSFKLKEISPPSSGGSGSL